MPKSVVVVGGGVIGGFAADALLEAGYAVTILDRGSFAGGCSHGNCGYVSPSHILPLAQPGALTATLKTLFRRNSPLKVRPGFALANLGWFLRFARRCRGDSMIEAGRGIQALLDSSRSLYDAWLAKEGCDVEWDTHGLMFVFHTAKAFDHYDETDTLLRERFGMKADRFDADELLSAEPALKPGTAAGAYLYRSDAQLRPDVLMKALRASLLRRGATIVENSPVEAILGNGTATTVRTPTGEYPADSFFFATGAWTPQLASLLGGKPPIIPGKGYSITMPRPALCPTYPMIFEEHRVAVSPFRTGLRIGSTMEFAGFDARMNPKRLELLKDAALFYLRDPGDFPAGEPWWGWRPMTPDGLPVIDRVPRFGNVWLAAGHGMLGLSMAPGTGRLAKELIAGERPHIDAKAYRWR